MKIMLDNTPLAPSVPRSFSAVGRIDGAMAREMRMIKRVVVLLFLSLVLVHFLSATTVGSDSAVSRQASVEFPEVDSDNEMNGFAAFENGFTFETADTTCTFDSFFPVSGTVDMKGGALYLQKGLKFDTGANLINLGTIYGNDLSIEFSDGVTTLTVYADSQGGGGMPGSWEQKDSENLTDDVNSVDWSYDDNYVVGVRNGNQIYVYSFNGSALTFVDSETTYADGYTVRSHPSGYYFLVNVINGYEIRLYKLSGSTVSRIDYDDSNELGRAVDWSADGNYAVVGSTVNVRVFSFASESISRVTDLNLGAGESFSRDAVAWDPTGDYIAGGITHSTASRLRIWYFNGSTLTAKTSVNTGSAAVTAVDWSHSGNFIAIGTNGGSNQLRVYEYNTSGDTLTERESISVGGDVLSVHWNSDTTRLLVGRASASGAELMVYTFDSGDYSLTLDLEAEKTTNINSVRWSNDDAYFAYGDSANNLTVYSYVPGVDGGGGGSFADSVLLDNVNFIFNNDMSWKMATTIQGVCSIDARDNIITIEDTGVLTIESGAQLTFENAELQGLTAQNFICADDTVSVVLRDCIIRLDNDFSFDTGSLLFDGEVVFTGTNKFIYTSSQASTINPNSTLMFDHDTTFLYDPSVANRDLISMTDETSFLYLNGCTLHSTATGIRLTNGTLFLDNQVTLSCEGSVSSEAISFGDGVLANDMTIKILSDACVDVFGAFCYKGVG